MITAYYLQHDIIACLATGQHQALPMFNLTHMIHRGLDNVLNIKIQDADACPVDIFYSRVWLHVIHALDQVLMLRVPCTPLDARQGRYSACIAAADTLGWQLGSYAYHVVVTTPQGQDQCLYLSPDYVSAGSLQLISAPWPDATPTRVFCSEDWLLNTITSGTSYLASSTTSAVPALSSCVNWAFNAVNYTGSIVIEASLESTPQTADAWSAITTPLMLTAATQCLGLAVQGKYTWTRARQYPASGTSGSIATAWVR